MHTLWCNHRLGVDKLRRPTNEEDSVGEWWETFFDQDYLRSAGQMLTDEHNGNQAADLWSMLDLKWGCRILDAPCGWGRLSRPLELLGATVLGVDHRRSCLKRRNPIAEMCPRSGDDTSGTICGCRFQNPSSMSRAIS